ncbi:MAG TPA: hypothetical protein VIF60_00875 [Burkholderiaceae bacterium]|jgi:hypothetical protein
MPKSNRAVGRPKKSLQDRIRTFAWARQILSRTDLIPTELSGILGDDGKWWLWRRYVSGVTVVPFDRVERIDRILPGTARYFTSPIWSLLDPRDFAKRELNEFIKWLPPDYLEFFKVDGDVKFGDRWQHLRSIELLSKIYKEACMVRTELDAATALFIMIRESELIEDSESFYFLVELLAEIYFEKQSLNWYFFDVLGRFFDTAFANAKNRQFADPAIEHVRIRKLARYVKHRGEDRLEDASYIELMLTDLDGERMLAFRKFRCNM